MQPQQPAQYLPMLTKGPNIAGANPLFGNNYGSPMGSQSGEDLLGGGQRRSSWSSPAPAAPQLTSAPSDVEMMQQMMAEINRLKSELGE